jgi:hypothetical protein
MTSSRLMEASRLDGVASSSCEVLLLGPTFVGVRVQLRIDTRTNQFSKTKRLLDFRPTLPGYRATLRRALFDFRLGGARFLDVAE